MGVPCDDPTKETKPCERNGKYSLRKSALNSDCILNGWEGEDTMRALALAVLFFSQQHGTLI